jgi:hypothetical protein
MRVVNKLPGSRASRAQEMARVEGARGAQCRLADAIILHRFVTNSSLTLASSNNPLYCLRRYAVGQPVSANTVQVRKALMAWAVDASPPA